MASHGLCCSVAGLCIISIEGKGAFGRRRVEGACGAEDVDFQGASLQCG